MLHKTSLLGVDITSETTERILEEVMLLLKRGQKFFIVTPNPEILVYANRHKTYKKVLNQAHVALPDGVGLFIAAKMLDKPLKERLTGVDFIEKLCKQSKDKPISMGFLGGGTKVAEGAVECLRAKYPWMEVKFVGEEWNEAGFIRNQESGIRNQESSRQDFAKSEALSTDDLDQDGLRDKNKKLSPRSYPQDPKNNRTIDLLFVAFGAPKQEEWIAENLEKLPIKAAMGVGGSFDYLSGKVTRAPSFIRSLGFEWLFRLIRQPWRWKRQLALIEFLRLVLKEKFGSKPPQS
jgi:N-acetylglucosaminyldiphosphoundecaprenol N-acetyl-beta-D-mannosaminyltransferase